ncbi:hypothetical protein NST99_22010 [Paenibacillus sp. FSL L8-0470]|uniref:hypothetical protein n=1 Tax=unclassified Paenibacillus TaxID=185978 RepID=UPI0030F69EE0
MSNDAERNNLKILGTSSSMGGCFLDVKVTGEGKFAGDVDCLSFSLTGNSGISGSLRTEKLKLTGEIEVKERLTAGALHGQGEIKCGSLSAERFKLSGDLEVSGDCEAEKLQMTGALRVGRLLNADILELVLFGPSRSSDVGGGSITIKRSKAGALLKQVQSKGILFTARVIEGDQVDIQNTRAEVVRGGNVIIGADCEIGIVEYRSKLEIHKSATVKQQVKVTK